MINVVIIIEGVNNMPKRTIYAVDLLRKFDFYHLAHEFYRYTYAYPELEADNEWAEIKKVAEDILVDVRCHDGRFEEVDPDWYRDFLRFYNSLEAKHYAEDREFIFEPLHIALFLKVGRRPKR